MGSILHVNRNLLKYDAFTLIEVLIDIALIAILSAMTIIAINPQKIFAQSRNVERWNGVRAIHSAIEQYIVEGNALTSLTEGDGSPIATCGTSTTAIMDAPTLDDGQIDLDNYLVGGVNDYIVEIPRDPTNSAGADTGYRLCQTAQNDRFLISAPGAELSVVISLPTYTDTLASGLIAYWSMNETTMNSCTGGEDTCDSSESGFNGTWESSMTSGNIVAGKFGNAVNFDDINDYITFGDVDLVTDFTIAAWIDPDVLVNDQGTILAKWSGNTGRWVFRTTPGGGLEVIYSSGVCGGVCSKYTADGLITTTGGWYHVATTYNSTSHDMELFINGTKRTKVNDDYFDLPMSSGSDELRIGRRQDNHDEVEGKIDDIRIYNRILTDEELGSLYTYTS